MADIHQRRGDMQISLCVRDLLSSPLLVNNVKSTQNNIAPDNDYYLDFITFSYFLNILSIVSTLLCAQFITPLLRFVLRNAFHLTSAMF